MMTSQSLHLNTTQTFRKVQPKDHRKKEIVPRIIQPVPRVSQPGGRFPSLSRDVTDVWTPRFPGTREQSNDDGGDSFVSKLSEQSELPKCKKYRNLFEYKQRHQTDFGLKKSLWKIPSFSSNVLPSSKVKGESVKTKMKISGLYEQDFRNWYERLTHENTVVLSPLEMSTRAKENVFDSTNLNEKMYVLNDQKRTAQKQRFASEELYLPDVYKQFFTCKECRSNYVSDMFQQKGLKRHRTILPALSRETTRFYKRVAEQQHCEVLGERYCRSCIETRNKRFSRDIEDKLLYVKELSKIHYK